MRGMRGKRLKGANLSPTEDSEQQAVVQWLDFHRIPFYHVPNGGSRNVIEGVKLKRLGVRAGVPDLCLPFGRQAFNALYVEMKRKGSGVVSKSQAEWLELLIKLGNKAIVCYGAEDAILQIGAYIALPRRVYG